MSPGWRIISVSKIALVPRWHTFRVSIVLVSCMLSFKGHSVLMNSPLGGSIFFVQLDALKRTLNIVLQYCLVH